MSEAAPAAAGVAAPAAAPVTQAPAAQPATQPQGGAEFGPVPYSRFQEVSAKAQAEAARAAKTEAELATVRAELAQTKDRFELADIRGQLGIDDDGIADQFRQRHKAAHEGEKPAKVPKIGDWVKAQAADPALANAWPKGLRAYFPEAPKPPAGQGQGQIQRGPQFPSQGTVQPQSPGGQSNSVMDAISSFADRQGFRRRV
jgi:hypothetical protein